MPIAFPLAMLSFVLRLGLGYHVPMLNTFLGVLLPLATVFRKAAVDSFQCPTPPRRCCYSISSWAISDHSGSNAQHLFRGVDTAGRANPLCKSAPLFFFKDQGLVCSRRPLVTHYTEAIDTGHHRSRRWAAQPLNTGAQIPRRQRYRTLGLLLSGSLNTEDPERAGRQDEVQEQPGGSTGQP